MERIDSDEKRPSLLIEHRHRYSMAAELARGAVLDASCGVGYGAPILMSQPAATSYTGIDVSGEAIEEAQINHSGNNVSFKTSDMSELPFEDDSFDTVVSLETLEHLENPEAAMKEIKRVLKKRKGVFIGSVPTDEYEAYCEEVFGDNEYHLSRFTYEILSNLLNDNFKAWKIYVSSLELGSLTRLRGQSKFPTTSSKERLTVPNQGAGELGSFFFVATDNPRFVLKRSPLLNHQGDFRHGINFAPFAKAEIIPLYDTIDQTEQLVYERTELVNQTEDMVELRDQELEKQSQRIRELELAIKNTEDLVKTRDKLIAAQDEIVRDREKSIISYENSVKEKIKYIQELEALVQEQKQRIEELRASHTTSIVKGKKKAANNS